jgi:hypothetical protein
VTPGLIFDAVATTTSLRWVLASFLARDGSKLRLRFARDGAARGITSPSPILDSRARLNYQLTKRE